MPNAKSKVNEKIKSIQVVEANSQPHMEEEAKPQDTQPNIRVARRGENIYLHLMQPGAEFVEISAAGWKTVNDCPVKFTKVDGMLPLPIPSTNGSSKEIVDLLGLSRTCGLMFVSWAYSCLYPGYSQPIMIVDGAQGAAKSTFTKVAKYLFDPNVTEICTLPRTEKTFAAIVQQNRVIAIDNVSKPSEHQQDLLCQASSGAGFIGASKLTYNLKNPVIVNGIGAQFRDDVLDRSIVIELDPISKEGRKTEHHIWNKIREHHASFLGFFLDALVASLANKTKQKELPRMADFAEMVIKCEKKLGMDDGEFLKLYTENREQSSAGYLSSNFVGQLLSERLREKFNGTATELLAKLNDLAGHSQSYMLPRNARALSAELTKISPALEKAGFKIIKERPGKEKLFSIMPPPAAEKVAGTSTANGAKQEENQSD